MILEGLVTTCDADGRMHLAAMGPEVDEAEVAAGRIDRLVLKPFATSQTAVHLARLGAGVFHATDDALLIARVVTGAAGSPPACQAATAVQGWVLDGAKCVVVGASAADWLLVSARTGGGTSLFVVPRGAAGVTLAMADVALSRLTIDPGLVGRPTLRRDGVAIATAPVSVANPSKTSLSLKISVTAPEGGTP